MTTTVLVSILSIAISIGIWLLLRPVMNWYHKSTEILENQKLIMKALNIEIKKEKKSKKNDKSLLDLLFE